MEEKKEKQEKVEQRIHTVVTEPVVVKKQSGFKKFLSNFVPDVNNIKDYLITDFLIPGIKRGISNVVDIFLYGNTGSSNRYYGRRSEPERYSYAGYYREPRDTRGRDYENKSRYNTPTYDEIYLKSRGEAELVIAELEDTIKKYKQVTVADLYQAVNITGSYTDNYYGWSDLRLGENVFIRNTRDGYLLDLPKPIPIE